MTESDFDKSLWSYASFLLWMVFLAFGFLAEETFGLFRLAGRVVPQYAMVNSPLVITLAFAGYLAYFTYHRCRERGQNSVDAPGRAVQMFVVGFLAFVTVTAEDVRQAAEFPSVYANLRNIIYVAFLCKSIAFLYLIALMARYYLFGNDYAFAGLFPSSRYQRENDDSAHPEDCSTQGMEKRSDPHNTLPETTVVPGTVDQATNKHAGQ